MNNEYSHTLSVVIPAFNEEKRIVRTISTILQNPLFPKKEIIVVNDGSKDATTSVIEAAFPGNPQVRVITLPENKGKGYSVKQGFIEAKNDLILFMDADSSTPFSEIEKFMPYIESNDIVIGSRHSPLERDSPLYRKFLSLFSTFIIKNILGVHFSDTQCGFKLFHSESAKKLASIQKIHRFAFDIELLSNAAKLKYKVVAVHIEWHHADNSTFRPVTDSFMVIVEILKSFVFNM